MTKKIQLSNLEKTEIRTLAAKFLDAEHAFEAVLNSCGDLELKEKINSAFLNYRDSVYAYYDRKEKFVRQKTETGLGDLNNFEIVLSLAAHMYVQEHAAYEI